MNRMIKNKREWRYRKKSGNFNEYFWPKGEASIYGIEAQKLNE